MAQKKVSDLDLADSLVGEDFFEVVQGGVNKRSTVEGLTEFVQAVAAGLMSFTLNPDIAVGVEDNVASGNVLTNDVLGTATELTVQQFTVLGNATIYPANNANVSLTGMGVFRMAATGGWVFTPTADWNGTVPTITYQATDGVEIKQTTLNITITAVNDTPRPLTDVVYVPVAGENPGITSFNPLINDLEIDHETMTVVQINGVDVVEGMSVSLPVDVAVSYTQANGFTMISAGTATGNSSFTYTVTDGELMASGTIYYYVTSLPISLDISPYFNSLYPEGWIAESGTTSVTEQIETTVPRGATILQGGFKDLTFDGVEIRKMVELDQIEDNISNLRHEYSRRQVFNADSTRFLMKASNGWWYQFDANTGEKIYGGRVGPPGNGAVTGLAGECEPIWHAWEPFTLAHTANNGGLIWYRRNMQTNTTTTLFDLGPHLQALGAPWNTATRAYFKGEGRPSDDWRIWGLMVYSGTTFIGIISYNLDDDVIVGTLFVGGVNPPDHISTSYTGDYIVPSWYTSAAGSIAEEQAAPVGQAKGARAYNTTLTSFVALSVLGEHSDLCWYEGPGGGPIEVLVAISLHGTLDGLTRDSIFAVRLDTGQRWEIPILPFNGSTGNGFHISGNNTWRPGYAVISKYAGVGAGPYDGGVVVAEIIPPTEERPAKIYRVAHHRSTGAPYESEPQATSNNDLTRIVWASNIGGTDDLVSYCAILPDSAFPAPGSTAPTMVSAPLISGAATPSGIVTIQPGDYAGVPSYEVVPFWERKLAGGQWLPAPGSNALYPYTISGGELDGTQFRGGERVFNTAGEIIVYTDEVTVGPLAAPVNLTLPSVPAYGETGENIQATKGTWSGNPTPVYDYVWQRDISGIWTDSAFTSLQAPLDVEGDWRVQVTATNNQGFATAHSATVGVIAPVLEPTMDYTFLMAGEPDARLLSQITDLTTTPVVEYAVIGGVLRANGTGYNEELVYFEEVNELYQGLELTFAAGSFPNSFVQANMWLNSVSGSTGYGVYVTASKIQLYRNGSYLGQEDHNVDTVNADLTVRITTFEGTIRVYLGTNTVPTITYQDAQPITTGNAGMRLDTNGVTSAISVKSIKYGWSPKVTVEEPEEPPLAATTFDGLYDPSWLPNSDLVVKTLSATSAPVKSTDIMTGGYVDAAFDVQVRKVDTLSDATDSVTFLRHDYSRRRPYNFDDTLRLTNSSNGGWYLKDAMTLDVVDGGRTVAPAQTGILELSGAGEPLWHPTNPNKLWWVAADGGRVWNEFDVPSKSNSVLFDLTSLITALGGDWVNVTRTTTKGEGRPSNDGRWWALMCSDNSFRWIGVIIYDRQNHVITGSLLLDGGSIDHCSMSPLGNYAVISWTDGGKTLAGSLAEEAARTVADCCGVRAYNRTMTAFNQLSIYGEHSDLGLGIEGEELFVWVSFHGSSEGVTDGRIAVTRLDDPAQRFSIEFTPFPTESGVSHGIHISCQATEKRPGYAVLSRYAGIGTNPMDWVVAVAELLPDGKIYRLAHNRTSGSPYEAECQATSNSDLTRLVWASNWDGTNELVTYEAILPSWTFPPAGSSPPVNITAPSITGTATQGGQLERTNGTWSGVPTPTVTGIWQVSTNSGSTWSDVAAQTNATYTIPMGAANGTQYRWRDRAVSTNGTVYAVSNVATVAALTAPVNTVAPVVPTTSYNTVVTTSTQGTWTGNPIPDFANVWQRNVASTWTDSSFTSLSATLDPVGEWRLKVVASNTQGTAAAVYSNTVTVTVAPAEPVVTQTTIFNQTDGTTLEQVDSTWDGDARYAVTSAALQVTGNGYVEHTDPPYLSSVTGNNQTAQIALAAGATLTPGGEIAYVYIHHNASNSGYHVRVTSSTLQLYKDTSQIGDSYTHGLTFASASTFRISSFQGRLRVYMNGSASPVIDFVDDTPVTTGSPGLGIYANGGLARLRITSFGHGVS